MPKPPLPTLSLRLVLSLAAAVFAVAFAAAGVVQLIWQLLTTGLNWSHLGLHFLLPAAVATLWHWLLKGRTCIPAMGVEVCPTRPENPT